METVDGEEVTDQPLNQDQEELSKILRILRDDPTLMGVISLGEDGVLRTLTADHDVVDAIALPPRLIKAMLDRLPFDQGMEDKFRGVDGTGISHEQWFHPDKALLPPPMSEETKEKTRKTLEENWGVISGQYEKMKRGEVHSACPVVRSNYNLGPKDGGKERQAEIRAA